jgi:hypothetical protein
MGEYNRSAAHATGDPDNIQIMIGWTAKKLLSELPTLSPAITSVSLNTYAPAPVLAARLGNRDVARIEPGRFVHEALRHRGYVSPILEIPVDQLSLALSGDPPSGEVRGFCSRVTLRGGDFAQLPLLDFQCEVRERNVDAIAVALKLLGQRRGALLASGRSYHYYGYDPLNQKEWYKFMSRAVLLDPLVDVRYVAHCLIDELACLRLDAHAAHPMEPVIVTQLG